MACSQITQRHRALLDTLAALGRPAHTSELRAAGAHPQTIAEAVSFGLIERLGPACYALPGTVPDDVAPYVELALRYPRAVVTGPSAEALREMAFGHSCVREDRALDVLEATLPRACGIPNGNKPVLCGGKWVSFKLSRSMPPIQWFAIAGVQVPVPA